MSDNLPRSWPHRLFGNLCSANSTTPRPSFVQERQHNNKPTLKRSRPLTAEHDAENGYQSKLAPYFSSTSRLLDPPGREMDVVYVQSDSGPRPTPNLDPLLTPSLSGDDTPASGAEPIAARRDGEHRSWEVSVRINDGPTRMASLTDPFPLGDYKKVFENYLHNSDKQPWTVESLVQEDSRREDNFRIEDRIKTYARALFDQLGLRPDSFSLGVQGIQLYVVERRHFNGDASAAGIHCLAWELLESIAIPWLPREARLRVTRVSDFPRRPERFPKPVQPLRSLQMDPAAVFNVLLVIARDFSRMGADRDPEPDLAQWPLTYLRWRLRGRMVLEVVRPGSREQLEKHLKVRAAENVYFNLVHFDLHGKIVLDAQTNEEVPCLLLAKHHRDPHQSHGYRVPQTNLARAEDIARLLAKYHVENVVLNSCLSAYNHASSSTNLADIFLKHGIQNVSAMWFYVRFQTAAIFIETFYNELFINSAEFHVAAQRGRDAVRAKTAQQTGRVYQDFFLCVNYTRNEHRSNTLQRVPSPAPSVFSTSSSASTASRKGFLSGRRRRTSASKLSDSWLAADEPVLRLELHHVCLEQQLMASRIVYASDLRRENQGLSDTIDQLVNYWLSTNLVDEVIYYKATDLIKRGFLRDTTSFQKKRHRASNGGYLQMLFQRPISALQQTLHIVRDVDAVVDPGYQADDVENKRGEERRRQMQEALQRFAEKLHSEGHSYLLFIGSQDAQWWRTYLEHLKGEWWVNLPWHYTIHSRLMRDGRLAGERRRSSTRME